MIKFTPKHQLKVAGNMSEADAGKAGLILAVAGLIFAILAGVALIVWASRPTVMPKLEPPSPLQLACLSSSDATGSMRAVIGTF